MALLGILLLLSAIFNISSTQAATDLCDHFNWASCPSDVSSSYSRSTSASNPSSSSAASSNPASISIAQGLGLEAIIYDKFDVGLASGNGRIGAAVSSQNSEETFFGNIAKENTEDFKARVQEGSSYRGHKYNLALGVKLAGDKRKKFNKKPPKWILTLGVMGKLNQETDRISPGLGLGLSLGPLNFGVAHFYDDYVDQNLNDEIRYRNGHYSAGIKLGPLVLDYSYTESFARERHRIKILSGNFYFSRVVVSYGKRWETSHRPKYNFEYKNWNDSKKRTDDFYGAQYSLGGSFMMGLFYNYYLLHELSLGLSAMF